jgi:HTH-type transcriptional regulator/antitoxin HipB
MDTKIITTRDLAAAIRGRRFALGMTQADLAARVGVSRPWLSQIESGKPTANIGLVIRLLDALGLQLEVTDRPPSADDSPTDLDALLDEYDNR